MSIFLISIIPSHTYAKERTEKKKRNFSCSHTEDLLNQIDLNQIDWLNFQVNQRDFGKIETS